MDPTFGILTNQLQNTAVIQRARLGCQTTDYIYNIKESDSEFCLDEKK